MSSSSGLDPIDPRQFGTAQAQHLLQRAGFGGTPQQVAQLVQMGLDQAVDHLVNFRDVPEDHLPPPQVDPDVIRPLNEEERQAYRIARTRQDTQAIDKFRRMFQERRRQDYRMYQQLGPWWIDRMIRTPRPLQEKLVLLWHGHFATRYRNVRDAYLMYQQNAFFREHCDNFARLASGIVRDPAMLRFLDNDRNINRRPNENLARELMELFTLGEGRYSERDIKEAARALTGYHFQDNDFAFHPRLHDHGEKTILGQRSQFDGDELVRLLLRQPACLGFVAYKLYRHFVADVEGGPEGLDAAQRDVVKRMAFLLRRHEYRLGPVLRTLFKSRHFYDPSVMGRQIKSPVQLLVGSVRMLGTPTRDMQTLSLTLRMMGQTLFDPPSVAGWDGGRAWINTATLLVRQNVCVYLITGKHPIRPQSESLLAD
ncbi:MAG TPA: DUF1800 domain-containing protein, partial [Phycisphaeraceae bacterium]